MCSLYYCFGNHLFLTWMIFVPTYSYTL
uniref:Uncharacterized protein n=1 Tax=Arundo donax TaxID=35708 RepID=A0A0A9FIR6_ARUDO